MTDWLKVWITWAVTATAYGCGVLWLLAWVLGARYGPDDREGDER